MNINIRMEGGLGDHLLANRFIPAILDKYQNAQIKVFSDTENNPNSLDLLLDMFPSFYKRGGEVIEARKNKTFNIISQFGQENYPAALDNQTDQTINKMIYECDKFYDLHIDSLKWTDHDYDWLRYYYHFPKPEKEFSTISSDKYIMAHLYARPDSPYNLDKTYTIELIRKLSESNKIIVITEDKYKNFYDDLIGQKNITINTASNLKEIFSIASGCSCFIGIDSGIRYIPYHFGKPTFVFSGYCKQYGEIIPSHLIRWLIFSKNVFPLNLSTEVVFTIINNAMQFPVCSLYPEILSNIDQYIVKRKYVSNYNNT
jgi:ADP-heptose:LPS heptosyltransferase